MKNSTIKRVILLGAIAVIAVLGIQTYWVLQTLDIRKKEFNQTVTTALIDVAKEIANYNGTVLPSQNLVSQRSSNYFIVNINDEIDANLLEYYLKKEFEIRALKANFEYGIYDCSSDKMVYGELITYSNEGNLQGEDLPKYGDLDYYFGVRFPDRGSDLLSSMGFILFFSAILLLTIVFFIYSMFVILRQRRMSEMQKDFINNMTHEFKTPISTIKISADVFKSHPSVKKDPRLARYAGIISEQNQRLNNQVEKVLQLARIEKNNFQLNLESVNLNELLQELIRNADPKLEELGGEINLSLPTATSFIQADETHLKNIMYNLIDNAIKYSEGPPKINIGLFSGDDRIAISIQDQGIGIPKDFQQKVFDKFYRIPTGNVHNVKGFGLGLFYIKNICRAHGWQIDLLSDEGAGTTLTISIKKTAAKVKRTGWKWLKRLQPSSNI